MKSEPIIVAHGSVRIKIYRSKNRGRDLFSAMYYEGGRRKQRNFADEEEARAEALKIARQIGTGHGAAISLTGKDRDNYTHAMRQLAELNIPLATAVEQYVDARKRLAETPLSHAVDFYVEKNAAKLPVKTVSEVVAEFLAAKAQDRRSTRYLEDCKHRLEKFAGAFKTFIGNIVARDIENWVRSLEVAPRTRSNFISLVATLFSFARARGYLPKGDTEADAVQKPKVSCGVPEIFSPEELGKLLSSAGTNTLPAFAIGAFAGLRQAEILRLHWEEIKFEDKLIEVTAKKSKTGQRRLAPILPALAAWLRPVSKCHGPVLHFALARTLSAAMGDVATKAGVAWKHNGLRHSFASYRVATIKNMAEVSLEMGNSLQIISSNYRELVTEKQGQEWFAVFPVSKNKKAIRFEKGRQQTKKGRSVETAKANIA